MRETRPCKYCGNPVARNASTCPKCGGKKPFPLTANEYLIGCFVLCGLLFTCCIWLPGRINTDNSSKSAPVNNPPQPVAQPAPAVQPERVESIRKGAIVQIDCPGEEEAFVAIDYSAHDKLLAASRQRNGAMVGQLVGTGRVFLVKKGTQATVADAHLLTVEVEIMEGPHSGKPGVVVREWVKP